MTDKVPTRLAFNKSNLDNIPFAPQGKQITYYDTNKTNLALRVGASSKTFIVYTRPKGSTAPVRISLGKYGVVTIKQAADLAAKELAKIADGRNPLEEKQQAKVEQLQAKEHQKETFQWMMDTYKAEHIIGYKGGAESTLKNIATALDYFDSKTVMTLKFTCLHGLNDHSDPSQGRKCLIVLMCLKKHDQHGGYPEFCVNGGMDFRAWAFFPQTEW